MRHVSEKIFFKEKSLLFNFYLLNSVCSGTEDAKYLAGFDVLWFLITAVDYIYLDVLYEKDTKGPIQREPLSLHITPL